MVSKGRTRFTGLAAWWVQRASAVYMLAFAFFLLATFAIRPVRDYEQWHRWVGSPGISIALAAFFAALLSHMWVGLRDVLLDYAKPLALQRVLLTGVAAGLITIAGSVVWILIALPR